uniref:Uncharacterized protein n=1 Tax=Acrobeloides nanus TaxID=290746 RepID=A0A914CC97_9BILA
MEENLKEIAKFSKRDAEAFPKYEDYMMCIGKTIEGIYDQEPLNLDSSRSKLQNLKKLYTFYKSMKHISINDAKTLQEVMFTSVAKVLNRWFENDIIKGTLSYDGVIGVPYGPYNDGTGYVLLNYVIGSVSEIPGVWGIVYGGMGSVSNAIASAAQSFGAELYTECVTIYSIIDVAKELGAIASLSRIDTAFKGGISLKEISTTVQGCHLYSYVY